MARKPAPPTFRLEQAWQLPDLKAVMLARACAAAALESPSAACLIVSPHLHLSLCTSPHSVKERVGTGLGHITALQNFAILCPNSMCLREACLCCAGSW